MLWKDCFNNRTKNQNNFMSRADRAVSWRVRRENNISNYKENVVMIDNMNVSGTEARWNSIPNHMRTMRQSSMLPFFDDSVDFEANYPHSHLRTERAPSPGITSLYRIPCFPTSNSIWSSSSSNDYYSERRMRKLESPFHQRVSYFNQPTVDENFKFPPASISPGYGRIQDHTLPSLKQEYIKEESPSVLDTGNEQQTWAAPLQSIDSNRRGLNFMKNSNQYLGESKTDVSKPMVKKDENSQSKLAVPRSWSQVVSSGDASNNSEKNNNVDYTRYTSKHIEQLDVPKVSIRPRPACSSRVLLSPPFSDPQQQQRELDLQSRDLIDHYNALSISSSAHTVQEAPPAGSRRYLSDSLGFAMLSPIQFSEFPEQRPYTVLRITNIPWSISSEDILRLIRDTRGIASPSWTDLPQSIHIFMDAKSGKTTGEAFVEVIIMNKNNLSGLLNRLSVYPVQGRHLRFANSNYDELRNHLFKNWKGVFEHGLAIPLKVDEEESGLGPLNNESTLFIGQKDLQGLLGVCRNYKIFYNRKCPERSFEYLMTVILNIPWLQKRCVSTIQRDLLYECYKLVIESLRIHTSKTLHAFESELMCRLIRTALTCNGFTIKQKQIILKNSHQKCPIDLLEYIQDPIIIDDSD
ncbi:unnamed protein product [Mucor hiemalis]